MTIPWSETEAKNHRSTARNCLFGDESHNRGDCKRYGQTARMSCGQCALLGYQPKGGWGDGYATKDSGPNYAGWARIYVEAGVPVPQKWMNAFEAQRNSDNTAYAAALERSILTFGVTWA